MIDWPSLSNREHKTAFDTLARLHNDLMQAYAAAAEVEPTRSPGLFVACHHITQEMHRANDELARRDVAMSHLLATQMNGGPQ